MKTGLAQGTTKSAKSLAQAVARQAAGEPLEILKTAKEQAFNVGAAEQNFPQNPESQAQGKIAEDQKEQTDKLKSARRIEALNREISDIRKQKLFDSLQKRVAEGERVSLENYAELSIEQKQVLKAQMEAVSIQNARVKSQSEGQLVEPAAKRGRQLFNFGKKTELKRQQTHVEKIVPPSG